MLHLRCSTVSKTDLAACASGLRLAQPRRNEQPTPAPDHTRESVHEGIRHLGQEQVQQQQQQQQPQQQSYVRPQQDAYTDAVMRITTSGQEHFP